MHECSCDRTQHTDEQVNNITDVILAFNVDTKVPGTTVSSKHERVACERCGGNSDVNSTALV